MMAEEFVDDESMVRRRRADFILKDNTEIIDIRAFQRTYEGAYLRTAMLEVTFSLSLLRIFDIEFYPVGTAFVAIGFSFMMIGLFRRIMSNRYITNGKPAKYFLTSGTPIFIMSIVCIISYIVIIPEIFRLQ